MLYKVYHPSAFDDEHTIFGLAERTSSYTSLPNHFLLFVVISIS